MRIIKIDTHLELTVHEFPSGSIAEQNRVLRELIGNKCRIYQHVMPRRLYTDLRMKNGSEVPGECVSMLVDEEGLLKENEPNLIGSFLYETDRHGHPIMGNILFVGEEWAGDGIDFCGIEDSAFRLLKAGLEKMILRARKEGYDVQRM